MISIRKWFISKMFTQPNCGRSCLVNNILLQFYYADEELNLIAAELDSFDGRKDPLRCTTLVNQLRSAQDKVITLIFRLMDEWRCERASRDYRLKFPDDLLAGEGAESLNGQIWFGAECLAAGSNIMNHELESALLRPMAKLLTSTLDQLRVNLRNCYGEIEERENVNFVCELEHFDTLFATFEYEYVKAMLPIKTAEEIEKQQELIVLFCETLSRALKKAYLLQSDIDECQPKVMIIIPRLAIVMGLMIGDGSSICKKQKEQLSSLFKPFYNLLRRIRDLLLVLRPIEVEVLERLLINEENLSQNINDDDLSFNSPNHHRKRSNSLPNVIPIDAIFLHKLPTKSASTFSLMASLKSTTEHHRSKKSADDSVSLSSTVTTTTSHDSFEIALAIGAKDSHYIPAQTRQLLHRLFVTISGVADQLQSNFASDMRNILRTVFSLNATVDDDDISVEEAVEAVKEFSEFLDLRCPNETGPESNTALTRSNTLTDGIISPELHSGSSPRESDSSVGFDYDLPNQAQDTDHSPYLLPPIWVPDELVSVCTLCSSQFTIIRRRHHCRNCGQIYCNNCSNHFKPLTHYGYVKPVRVCKLCYGQTQNFTICTN